MMWFADKYQRLNPEDINRMDCMTDKPLAVNGIEGRNEAAGRGVRFAVQAFFKTPTDAAKVGSTRIKQNEKSVVVQGLGNVGYGAAKFLSTEGK